MKKEPDIIDLKWISKNNSYISTFKFFNTDGNENVCEPSVTIAS